MYILKGDTLRRVARPDSRFPLGHTATVTQACKAGVHFGIPDVDGIERAEVLWSPGSPQDWEKVQ